jgi:hypothetical protein
MNGISVGWKDANRDKDRSYHKVRHSFREEIIVPIAAVTNNVEFLLNNESCVRMVKTTDNIECCVESYSVVHMCQLSDDIKRLYNMDPWPWIMRWYGVEPNMHSMEFVKLKLKKYGN